MPTPLYSLFPTAPAQPPASLEVTDLQDRIQRDEWFTQSQVGDPRSLPPPVREAFLAFRQGDGLTQPTSHRVSDGTRSYVLFKARRDFSTVVELRSLAGEQLLRGTRPFQDVAWSQDSKADPALRARVAEEDFEQRTRVLDPQTLHPEVRDFLDRAQAAPQLSRTALEEVRVQGQAWFLLTSKDERSNDVLWLIAADGCCVLAGIRQLVAVKWRAKGALAPSAPRS